MIFDHVPYVQSSQIISPPAAALAMLVGNICDVKTQDIAISYENSFQSMGFSRWLHRERGISVSAADCIIGCMEYSILTHYPEYGRIIKIPTTPETVYGSYIRRGVAVAMYGRFPTCTGHYVPNVVVVIGRIGNYLIVNDPIGNANTQYLSSYGDKVLYHVNNMTEWTAGETASVRIMSDDSRPPISYTREQ